MTISKALSRCLTACLILSLSAATLSAQAPPTQEAKKPSKIVFSGSLRTRMEIWDWFNTPAADGEYAFSGSILKLGLAQQSARLDWQVEAATPLLLGLPTNAIAPAPRGQLGLGASYYASNHGQTAGIFLKQGFVRFKGIAGDKASSLRLGRFEFSDGAEVTPEDGALAAVKRDRIAQRLLGPFGFTHVGRSFDGLSYVRNTPRTNFTFLGARATRGVFQLDGMREMDVDVLYGAFTRQIKRKSPAEARFFVLHYHDGRPVLKTDNRPAAVRSADKKNIRLTTVGSHYLQAFSAGAGKYDLLLWGALQTGHWGTDDHLAGAFSIEAGYQRPKARLGGLQPWVRGGYSLGSGDGNPADTRHHTFFQVLPTPRIYARFPFHNMMNNQDVFGEVILRPGPAWSLRWDLHHLSLAQRKDLWYQGGGAFQKDIFGYVGRPSNNERTLAILIDFSADYRLSSQIALTFYLARALGHGVIERIYPQGANATYGYIELTWRF